MTSVIPTAPPLLAFSISDVVAARYVAAPTLQVLLRIASGEREIRSLSLNVQLRIETTRRGYDDEAQKRLLELFGTPDQWDASLRSILWAQTSLTVPAFTDETLIELPVPCTYDFDVAATKYLDALAEGEIPIELLFSGTMFYAGSEGQLQTALIPWDREAHFRMPAAVWHASMDNAFPGTAWIRLSRESLDRLHERRAAGLLPSWDATIDSLLDGGG